MTTELRKSYFKMLLPAVAGFGLAYAARLGGFSGDGLEGVRPVLAPLLFVLCATFGLALPIWVRAHFGHRVRQQQSVSRDQFLHFQRRLMQVALVTPYLTLAGYWFALPKFYLSGAVLMTLYAVYYFYPSRRRLEFDQRIFRVR
jgi:hypothetical protein